MTSSKNQKLKFLEMEGDSWFNRNQGALSTFSPIREFAVSAVAAQLPRDRTSRVLEIGCGRGDNLAALGKIRNIEAHGIEPSIRAIEAGRAAFHSLNLHHGTADNLPFDDESCDLVWFGFCLYLVDRSLLMRVVAEADRVLRDGGIVAIIDFDPNVPSVREYHHCDGLHSYKMDYSRLFLANPAYSLMEKVSVSHADTSWTSDPQERIGVWLCAKQYSSAYHAA